MDLDLVSMARWCRAPDPGFGYQDPGFELSMGLDLAWMARWWGTSGRKTPKQRYRLETPHFPTYRVVSESSEQYSVSAGWSGAVGIPPIGNELADQEGVWSHLCRVLPGFDAVPSPIGPLPRVGSLWVVQCPSRLWFLADQWAVLTVSDPVSWPVAWYRCRRWHLDLA